MGVSLQAWLAMGCQHSSNGYEYIGRVMQILHNIYVLMLSLTMILYVNQL